MEFSIVIPCFNRPQLLHRALMSCVAQSYSNFEVVVIDDGSTDDIKSVVEKIEDRRIRYFRQKVWLVTLVLVFPKVNGLHC